MNASLEFYILGKILISALLGGIVGLEREAADKAAGFRTNMFIAGTATILISLGDVITDHFASQPHGDQVQTDPISLFEAIIVGVSFIGGGMIFANTKGAREGMVYNLTTAASLLFTSGIGVCVALDLYILAVGLTIISLIINFGLKFVDTWLSRKNTKIKL
jgi:putative Mg2+ transporter-C (MgtC) family protein